MLKSDHPNNPATTYLKDYRPPAFLVEEVDLTIDLYEDYSLVSSTLKVVRNLAEGAPLDKDLQLDIESLEVLECTLNEQAEGETAFEVSANHLVVSDVPDQFELRTQVKIYPHKNTSLMGLYKSRTMYCTQCEAEGFRKITPFIDRPDVLSRFTTTITAEKSNFPVLLSNGNLIAEEFLEEGRHKAVWQDPFPKPCYLFAMVAGNLEHVRDQFTTSSGRQVDIRLYVESKDLDKCEHALKSLKNAMRWDEQVFGREYDLDIFMIVAVDDFNMGAMENKGLNIFNTSAVLTNSAITTDQRFQWVEAVVAHEYFHNWSGNRVTCRDWFQLSLKEGFTVYRDSEFSADMNSRTVKRIENVRMLRAFQFAEDAGPLAHPVQPPSYQEINNFYTLTVYEKGAEVVRMQATLLGPELFRAGTDLYFDRFDGQAVTIDDFVSCMAEVSGRDLTQFKNWYCQAGTPKVEVRDVFDADQQRYELHFEQSCPPTPESKIKQPFVIPVKTGLLGESGDLPLYSEGLAKGEKECILEINKESQVFVFDNVKEKPVPSLLRDFSAPVKLNYPYSEEQLVHLMNTDSNEFNRWAASQQFAHAILSQMKAAISEGQQATMDSRLTAAWRNLLTDTSLDPAVVASMVLLPSMEALIEGDEAIDLEAVFNARQLARESISAELEDLFRQRYFELESKEKYQPSAEQIAKRSLRNICLVYWLERGSNEAIDACRDQYMLGSNMTDVSSVLSALVNSRHPRAQQVAEELLNDFYEKWQHESLVVNQWLAIQAGRVAPGALKLVKTLLDHPAYDDKNPNKIRSLVGAFCTLNPENFHHSNASGYEFLADQVIKTDKINPQVAARLVNPLTKWKNFNGDRSQLMHNALSRINLESDLSRDLHEVVEKAIQQS